MSTDVYKQHYRNKVKRRYAVFLTDDGKRCFVEDLCETDGKVAIFISTNALGKGIDIPDVRILVIIGGLPFSSWQMCCRCLEGLILSYDPLLGT